MKLTRRDFCKVVGLALLSTTDGCLREPLSDGLANITVEEKYVNKCLDYCKIETDKGSLWIKSANFDICDRLEIGKTYSILIKGKHKDLEIPPNIYHEYPLIVELIQ